MANYGSSRSKLGKAGRKPVGNRAPGFTRGKSASAGSKISGVRPPKPVGTREGASSGYEDRVSRPGTTAKAGPPARLGPKPAKTTGRAYGESGVGRASRAATGVPGTAGSASSAGAPTRPAGGAGSGPSWKPAKSASSTQPYGKSVAAAAQARNATRSTGTAMKERGK